MENVKVVLFDWGDTLMVDFGCAGPMCDWSRVKVYDDVPEVLDYLSKKYRLGVATNANESGAEAVRKALERVGIGSLFERIYSSCEVGARKPEVEFFNHILRDLDLAPNEVCMIGDSFRNDVEGPLSVGMPSLWLNRGGQEVRRGQGYETVFSFQALRQFL